MKLSQIIPALMLGLAAAVTAGSVYVTVQAAAQQDGDPLAVPNVPDAVQNPLEVVEVGQEDVVQDGQDPQNVLHDRGHYFAIDENGAFTGRLVTLKSDGTQAAGGLTVKFLRNNSVIAQTTTADDGTFQVQGLTEGTTAFLAHGADQFLLYAVNLKRVDHFDGVPAIQEAGMTSAVTSGPDARLAKELVYGSYEGREWRFQGAAAQPDQAYPDGLQQTPSTSTVHHNVQLRDDGSLVGEINLLDPRTGHHRYIRDLTAHFISKGNIVGSTEVAADGSFRMDGLRPGIHSIVTTGRDGVLALGINILGTSVAQNSDSKYKLTSVSQSLDLVVAPVTFRNFNPQLVDQTSEPIIEGTVTDLPMMAAPMGAPGGGIGGIGGGAGAGGGMGGGGGLGALLGAAAGAGIGYAVANDDDDAPASPAR